MVFYTQERIDKYNQQINDYENKIDEILSYHKEYDFNDDVDEEEFQKSIKEEEEMAYLSTMICNIKEMIKHNKKMKEKYEMITEDEADRLRKDNSHLLRNFKDIKERLEISWSEFRSLAIMFNYFIK